MVGEEAVGQVPRKRHGEDGERRGVESFLQQNAQFLRGCVVLEPHKASPTSAEHGDDPKNRIISEIVIIGETKYHQRRTIMTRSRPMAKRLTAAVCL